MHLYVDAPFDALAVCNCYCKRLSRAVWLFSHLVPRAYVFVQCCEHIDIHRASVCHLRLFPLEYSCSNWRIERDRSLNILNAHKISIGKPTKVLWEVPTETNTALGAFTK